MFYNGEAAWNAPLNMDGRVASLAPGAPGAGVAPSQDEADPPRPGRSDSVSKAGSGFGGDRRSRRAPRAGIRHASMDYAGDGYLLVDARGLPVDDLPDGNAATLLAQIENVEEAGEVSEVVGLLWAWLGGRGDAELRRILGEWLGDVAERQGVMSPAQHGGACSMANGEQVKALIESHIDGDDGRFFSVAMQVAAHEARRGHGRLAEELRALIDDAKNGLEAGAAIPIARPRGELANLLEASYPSTRLGDMVLGTDLGTQIQRVIREQRHAARIVERGLAPRRKLLLTGPPGTGKTLTASVLAGELGFPLFRVRLDGLITKYMGETAAKLRQIFEATAQTRGVYLFDEFDAIGSQRGLPNDVGEIRRILNSFLQMIEQDRSHSLVVAATNHPGILDSALFRRFDDVLHYALPDRPQIARLLKTRLSSAGVKRIRWKTLADLAFGLSYAEIAHAADEALKDVLIHERPRVREADIRVMLKERQSIAGLTETTA